MRLVKVIPNFSKVENALINLSSFLYFRIVKYTKEQILKVLRAKKSELEKDYHISELGLFGSYARDNAHAESDIDILVDFSKKIDGFSYIQLAHELEDLFQYKIDLVSRGGIKRGYLPYVEKNLIHV